MASPASHRELMSSPPPPRPRRRRLLRIAGWLVLGVLLGAALGGWWFTRPAALIGYASSAIHKKTGGTVVIDDAHLSWGGELRLMGVRVRAPGVEGEAGRVLRADRIAIELEVAPLLSGEVKLRRLEVERPTVYVTEDLDAGSFIFSRLRPEPDKDERRDAPPEVVLHGGRVIVGELSGGAYHQRGDLALEGAFTRDPEDAEAFDFTLRQRLAAADSTNPHAAPVSDDPDGVTGDSLESEPAVMAGSGDGAVLTGRVSLKPLAVRVRLDRLGFGPESRGLLPRVVLRWWDRLDPRGEVPSVVASFDSDAAGRLTFRSAELLVEDLSLDLPFGLDPAYTPRMERVTGRLVVEGDRLRVDHLTGLIEGVRYAIDGWAALDPEGPLELTVVTEPFTVPAEPVYVFAIPPKLRLAFDRFAPRGRFQSRATLRRSEEGELLYDGVLEVLDASLVYEKFPLAVEGVRGRVRFARSPDPEGGPPVERVELDRMTGRGPSGGTWELAGTVLYPGKRADVDLTLAAHGVPLDEVLLAAFKEEHRKVIEAFVDRRAMERLRAGGATGVRVFELGGPVHGEFRLRRERGLERPTRLWGQVQLAGLGVVLKDWPYPLRVTGGTLELEPEAVVVHGLTFRGLTGGTGTVSGRVDRVAEGRYDPDLDITAAKLPVDALLLGTVPEPWDQTLTDLRLSGEVAASGRVFADEAGRLDFHLDASLDDADARPFGGGFPLEHLVGKFTLTRHSLELTRATGQAVGQGTGDAVVGDGGQTRVSISGGATWGRLPRRHAFRVRLDDLALSPDVLDLMPDDLDARATLLDLFEQHHPAGHLDAEVSWRGGADAEATWGLELEPRHFAFDYEGERVNLAKLKGRVAARPGVLEFEDVSGEFDGGDGEVSGLVGLSRPLTASLNFKGKIDTWREGPVRLVMPEGAKATVDGLDLTGPMRVESGRLLLRRVPGGTGGEARAVEFEAAVALLDNALDVGVPLEGVRGRATLRVVGEGENEDAIPRVTLTAEADELRAQGRRVEDLSVAVNNAERSDRLVLERLRGTVYGGELVGEGTLRLDEPRAYRVKLTLHDAAADPVMEPEAEGGGEPVDAAPPDPSADDTTPAPRPETVLNVSDAPDRPVTLPDRDLDRGLLSASLALEGTLGDPESRHGRGALEIRSAELFHHPLTMAILQATNLGLPVGGWFDRATARYLLDGDTIRLDSLRLSSPSLSMHGMGTVQLGTGQLDLQLFTRNPGLKLGPLSGVLNSLKDELIPIRVGGTLSEPEARVEPLEGLTRGLLGRPKPDEETGKRVPQRR